MSNGLCRFLPLCACLAALFLHGVAAAQPYSDDEYYPYAEREERRPLLTTDTRSSTGRCRAGGPLRRTYRLHAAGCCLPDAGGWTTTPNARPFGNRPFVSLPHAFAIAQGRGDAHSGPAAGSGSEGPGLVERPWSAFRPGSRCNPTWFRRVLPTATTVSEPAGGDDRLGRTWLSAPPISARPRPACRGVFTNAVTGGFRLWRPFGESGDEGTLSLPCSGPARGTRLSTSEEAFTLTGDRLYNPAWGFQEGRVRNSRVRRETLPLTVVTRGSGGLRPRRRFRRRSVRRRARTAQFAGVDTTPDADAGQLPLPAEPYRRPGDRGGVALRGSPPYADRLGRG